MKPTILSVLGSILLSACSIGRGDGFVRGNLALTQCRQGDALEAPDFDLGAEFFFGDPLIDFDDSVELRRSSLTIRIQDTSNRLETSDGLMLLLPDLRYAARAYADARPLSADDCFESGGCPTEDYSRVRAKLSLFNSCPDNRSPIVAAPRDVVRKNVVAADNCLRSDTVRAACPTLSPAQLAELDEICAGDLNDANAIQPRIEAILGQGAESGSDRVGVLLASTSVRSAVFNAAIQPMRCRPISSLMTTKLRVCSSLMLSTDGRLPSSSAPPALANSPEPSALGCREIASRRPFLERGCASSAVDCREDGFRR